MRFFYTFLLFLSFLDADSTCSKECLAKEIATPSKLDRIAITCYGGAVHK